MFSPLSLAQINIMKYLALFIFFVYLKLSFIIFKKTIMKKPLSYLILLALVSSLFTACHICKVGVCAPCKCSICKKHVPAPQGACSDGMYIFKRMDMEEIIGTEGLLLYDLDNGNFAMVRDNQNRQLTEPSHIRERGKGCPIDCDVAVTDRNVPISVINTRVGSANNPGMHNRIHLERGALQPLIDQGFEYIAVFVAEDQTKDVSVMGFNAANVTPHNPSIRAHRNTIIED